MPSSSQAQHRFWKTWQRRVYAVTALLYISALAIAVEGVAFLATTPVRKPEEKPQALRGKQAPSPSPRHYSHNKGKTRIAHSRH